MIRTRRGREPVALRTARAAELPRVRAMAAVRPVTRNDVGTEYNVAKETLWRRQHYKCCYCEHLCQLNYHDAEHYRPKSRAERGPGFPVYGYWWLAWTWSNLMFACPGCNRSGKNDGFPLAAGSTPLAPEDAPPGSEHPLLIDPGAENPMPHIQFVPVRKNKKRQWVPVPRNASSRGQATIIVLKLDRPELLDLYEKHVNDHVMPAVEAVRSAINGGVRSSVQSEWQDRVVPLTGRTRPHAALSYDVVDQEIRRPDRLAWGLALNSPQ